MSELQLYTHGDLDGIASASIYIKIAKEKLSNINYSVNFVEPTNLDKALSSTISPYKSGSIIAIMDIGVNRSNFEKVLSILSELTKRFTVEWYDHHIWPKEFKDAINSIGVKLFVEEDTCAAGVVSRHAFGGLSPEDDNTRFFVDSVCSADLWKWEEWFSPFLYRILGSGDIDVGSNKWKRFLIEEFSNGRYWSDSFDDIVEKYINLELEGYNKALKEVFTEQCKRINVAYLYKKPGPPNASLLGHYLLSKTGADIVVIYRESGVLSFRSKQVDVSSIARCIGGGGHKLASGAEIKLPFYYFPLKIILKPLFDYLIKKKVMKKVNYCISETDIAPT
ncbi:hypothetical protein IOK49_05235 [Fervidicoccus fontis]|uniref:DHHA1 domain-containing protein n=1 Tax=Fervidicoccus fontis TaxID=683846 RepID=A0A2J6N7R4_9CREN|nr:DHHA1 domain-containing protein [Fervidicoccus fontis]MBE9391474.1 hypothetical protein [Fervidicoccus fontis]PMB75480.1 MAG: hypothetical protein C0188_03105 [Fervidicoccus fontis]PMB77345.1 MAG: hypothetical protein C0177_03545 [Fervidicoccus fontis]HEW64071.1 hypothetical protein [Fervidicoccus fontis]